MNLRAVMHDCLFLNWALPAEALPDPPAPLRYQRHAWQGRDHVFVSALLFHQDAVRWSAFPLLRVGYPQLNVRFYVLDEEGVPAVLFQRELMPRWVAPGVRLISRHPVASARLDFPRPSQQAGAGSWSWRAERQGTLTVRAWMNSPGIGPGPRIGDWQETVRYFQDRPRGYALHGGTLHRVEASHPTVDAVWPLAAEVGGDGLLSRLLPPLAPDLWEVKGAPEAAGQPARPARPQDGNGSWPELHSTWLCPEMPFAFAFDLVPRVHPVVQHVPHPAAGRVGSPAFAGSPHYPAAPSAALPAQGRQRAEARLAGAARRSGRTPGAGMAAGAGVLASAA